MNKAAVKRVEIGDCISLRTSIGSFQSFHLQAKDEVGDPAVEGVAISSIKDGGREPVMLRIQSSCLFSESFGSLDCDCALQLSDTLKALSQGEGLLIYFYEEGRGMGLLDKFRDIRLQQTRGMDSMAACSELNIVVDNRSYQNAAEVALSLLGDRGVILMSNNLDKERCLREAGLNVTKRESLLSGFDNPEIRRYLANKRRIFGHDIPME